MVAILFLVFLTQPQYLKSRSGPASGERLSEKKEIDSVEAEFLALADQLEK